MRISSCAHCSRVRWSMTCDGEEGAVVHVLAGRRVARDHVLLAVASAAPRPPTARRRRSLDRGRDVDRCPGGSCARCAAVAFELRALRLGVRWWRRGSPLDQDAAEHRLPGGQERLLGEARVLLAEQVQIGLAEVLDRPPPPVELLEVEAVALDELGLVLAELVLADLEALASRRRQLRAVARVLVPGGEERVEVVLAVAARGPTAP